MVFAKTIIVIMILPRKMEKRFSSSVHCVHCVLVVCTVCTVCCATVLIAGVHRLYKSVPGVHGVLMAGVHRLYKSVHGVHSTGKRFFLTFYFGAHLIMFC